MLMNSIETYKVAASGDFFIWLLFFENCYLYDFIKIVLIIFEK